MAAAGLVALEDGPGAAARGPRARAAPGRRRRRAAARHRSIPARLKRTWSTSTRKRWGSSRSTRSGGCEDLGVGATFVSGKVRMVTHLDVDDDGLALALDAWRVDRRADDREGDVMGLFTKNYPRGDRRARSARAAAGQDVAGAALRADPEVRRDELGPGGLGARRAPVHALLRGAAGAAARDGATPTCTASPDGPRSTTPGRASRSDAPRDGASRRPRRSG